MSMGYSELVSEVTDGWCDVCADKIWGDISYLIGTPESILEVCAHCYSWEAWKIPGNLSERFSING